MTESANMQVIVISASDLPLHCPRPEDTSWNSHPKVFIAIEDSPDQSAQCPYCGAKYQLQS